ncbi:Cpe/LpqF family protein [Hoyosella rhizosphaerae]|uniref:ORF 12 gene product N-terminal domain-containing protein n=1 Tax=Hoyosella rhizosphaerae TaxID=1755582 RepID=A0A916UL62_9ACTN|nr:Cpe/LpqF family protein [Hoyosella rhizosphaerae]MBN4925307.1 Cpe/LpqF family protein [Hoyosella rhizosphaerae]GGC76337.1 hypothetical protein GCM10011410_31980 [Hoyosella rhizosphaerae]
MSKHPGSRRAAAALCGATIACALGITQSTAIAEPLPDDHVAHMAAQFPEVPADVAVDDVSRSILHLIHADEPVTVEIVAAELSPADPSISEILANTLERLRTTGPYEVLGYSSTETRGTAQVISPLGVRFDLRIESTGDGEFKSMLIRPHTPRIVELDELASTLDMFGTDYSVLAARIDETSCEKTYGIHTDTVLPSATLPALQTLSALSESIAANDVHWDDTLDFPSLMQPDVTPDEDNGDAETVKATIREAATRTVTANDAVAHEALCERIGVTAGEADNATAPASQVDLCNAYARLLSGDEAMAAILTHAPGTDTPSTDTTSSDVASPHWRTMHNATHEAVGTYTETWVLTDTDGDMWYFGLHQSTEHEIGLVEQLFSSKVASDILGVEPRTQVHIGSHPPTEPMTSEASPQG